MCEPTREETPLTGYEKSEAHLQQDVNAAKPVIKGHIKTVM